MGPTKSLPLSPGFSLRVAMLITPKNSLIFPPPPQRGRVLPQSFCRIDPLWSPWHHEQGNSKPCRTAGFVVFLFQEISNRTPKPGDLITLATFLVVVFCVFVWRHVKLGGGFKYVLISSLLGEDSHFDSYFSDGLKPPTSKTTGMSCWYLGSMDVLLVLSKM